jgi:hypothetical protein
MQALLSLYFSTVLIGGAVLLCRAGLRELPRIGAALARREEQAKFDRLQPGFWTRVAFEHQQPGRQAFSTLPSAGGSR